MITWPFVIIIPIYFTLTFSAAFDLSSSSHIFLCPQQSVVTTVSCTSHKTTKWNFMSEQTVRCPEKSSANQIRRNSHWFFFPYHRCKYDLNFNAPANSLLSFAFDCNIRKKQYNVWMVAWSKALHSDRSLFWRHRFESHFRHFFFFSNK